MHYKEVKGILSPQNGMNIYRGCSNGCIYCDTRSKCYSFEHDIEDIEIKTNAVNLLEKKLISKRQKCMISTGSMTDPYIALEEKIGNTRKCLEIIYKYGFGSAIITKSSRILRDLDLLKKINEKSKCVVEMTLTTYDEDLCKILEPNVSTTKERFEALKTMHENNIPTVVWLSPILPFINDTKENLMGILNYCIEAKVKGIICFNMGLTLREGNREYFYQKLDEHFPGLKKVYQKKYNDRYSITSDKNNELMKIFYEVCEKNNIESDYKKIFEYLRYFPEKTKQLTLFD